MTCTPCLTALLRATSAPQRPPKTETVELHERCIRSYLRRTAK